MLKIVERVRAGINFLDLTLGKRWRRKINLRELDLADDCRCVLGQIGQKNSKEYLEVVDELGISEKTAYLFGFQASPEDASSDGRRESYKKLTTLWKKLLEKCSKP